jgi:uncharacterized protein YbjT (DUF2867 family)
MPSILVIGATGNVGRQVVRQLTEAGIPVRAMVRNPQTANLPPQVEVVAGDLTIPETLDGCLDGIDAVFLVWIAPLSAVPAALDRITNRVRRIVFLSAPLKTPHPLFQQPNAVRLIAEEIERRIESSGVQWTFLRPGMFASNALEWWARQVRAGDTVRWPYLAVPTAPIDPRDIAAIGVRALCGDGHSGAEYLLTGPESLTHAQQIETIGRTLGRSLRVEEIPLETAQNELAQIIGFPPVIARLLLNAWAAAAGHPAFMSSTFAEITGTPPRTFQTWAADHAALFRAGSQAGLAS